MAEDMATISANKSAVLSVDLMEVSHKRRAMTFATTGQDKGIILLSGEEQSRLQYRTWLSKISRR